MEKKENILLGGGTGLVGKPLVNQLQKMGFGVHILTRNPRGRKDHFGWDIRNKRIDPKAFENVKHIINLTGEGIASGLWTAQRKKRIIDSRVESNRLLINQLEKNKVDFKSFITASAVGIYGDGGNNWQTENDQGNPNEFLVKTCIAWEETLDHPFLNDKRRVKIRIGLVLSPDGGVLPKMLMTFKLGIGNYFGSGNQYYPWIHIKDICRIFAHAVADDSVQGAYNGCAPNPRTNKEIIAEISETLNKNTIVSVPKILLKIGMGEMHKVVMNSNRTSADKIVETGFEFKYPELKPALEDLLKSR